MFAYLCIHIDESSPLPYCFHESQEGLGTYSKLIANWDIRIYFLRMMSLPEAQHISSRTNFYFFLFNFQLCFYQTISEWMYKHSVPSKHELKRLPSGMHSSDSLLKYTKSPWHFSSSFSHTWTNCLASCHGSKIKKFKLHWSRKESQELRTFCRWDLQFSKTSLPKMN